MTGKPRPSTKAAFPNLSKLSVLVVDDMNFGRTMARSLLLAAGVRQVEVASDASEAWPLIRDTPPDLLILDWELADESGIDLLKMVRTSHDSPDTAMAVLMLTAYREEYRVREAISAGITSYLTKPFTAGDFILKVKFCIDAQQGRRRKSLRLNGVGGKSIADDQLMLD